MYEQRTQNKLYSPQKLGISLTLQEARQTEF